MSENEQNDRAALLAVREVECKELRDRLAACEQARQRAELLSEASAVLSASLDDKVVLDQVARLVVRWFADWCVIDVLEDGEILRVGGAHADAPELSDEDLRRLTPDDEHRRLVTELGPRNGLTLPLAVDGAVLGAISAGSGQPDRHFGPAELDLMQELARRAAMAIQNARLHRQTQEAVRLRDEFLSVASHELNTPMAALMLSLEALGADDPELGLDPDSVVHVARLAERQGKRLTKLIGDLLDVTRMSRGALELNLEEVELTTLVREVVARYKPELERAGCETSLELSGPVKGKWDAARLDQVVLNLVANAAKFGAHRPIEIRVDERDGNARLSVADHGIGVDAAQRQRIFERFERGVGARSYGGLGLGLYICRRIVESHRGTIQVESSPGQGAIFTVQLPLDPAGESS